MIVQRCVALPERLVEHQRGGDADVERLDRLLHGNRDAPIDLREHLVWQPRPFAAEDQRRRLSEVCVEQRLGRRAARARSVAMPRRSKRREHVVDVGARDRQSQRAAHGSAQRLPAERVCGRGSRDERRGARGFGRAHDAADVARILNIVRDDDERVRGSERVGQRRQRAPRDADGARTASAPGSSTRAFFARR